MRNIGLLCVFLIVGACNRKHIDSAANCLADSKRLLVSEVVDVKTADHALIISALEGFLNTKDQSLCQNAHWLESDFKQYVYPYLDLYKIEDDGNGDKNFYRPSLMGLVKIKNTERWMVKLAFIGSRPLEGQQTVKAIYNLIAEKRESGMVFSKYMSHYVQDWQTLQRGSITYKISPLKTADEAEMHRQQLEITKLLQFYDTQAIPIAYYSCINPKELMEVKGYDYSPIMYISENGGMAEKGNIVLSGNNSEYYTHEIVHQYNAHLYPDSAPFFNEGLATYIGGSGAYDYAWHRAKFKKFVAEYYPNFQAEDFTNPYISYDYEGETAIAYLIPAVVCERTVRLYGKQKLFEILQSKADLWTVLDTVGLNKANLTEELTAELQRPLHSFDQLK
ncbi:hypothetical protein [Flavobacterium sp. JP2137]|uniref:hypothetical protein n=1 Tax=Flavobacterium sp. JP2137 TaxID=3414510 RepID=UPI003D300809